MPGVGCRVLEGAYVATTVLTCGGEVAGVLVEHVYGSIVRKSMLLLSCVRSHRQGAWQALSDHAWLVGWTQTRFACGVHVEQGNARLVGVLLFRLKIRVYGAYM